MKARSSPWPLKSRASASGARDLERTSFNKSHHRTGIAGATPGYSGLDVVHRLQESARLVATCTRQSAALVGLGRLFFGRVARRLYLFRRRVGRYPQSAGNGRPRSCGRAMGSDWCARRQLDASDLDQSPARLFALWVRARRTPPHFDTSARRRERHHVSRARHADWTDVAGGNGRSVVCSAPVASGVSRLGGGA